VVTPIPAAGVATRFTSMQNRFENKTAIVTGGASGIGAAYVRAFAAAGANVVIADVQDDPGADLSESLNETGSRTVFVHTDVSSEQDSVAMAARALDTFGTIDALINNAALYMNIEKKRPFDEIPVGEWDRMMAVNVRGVWLCCKAVVGSMREAGRGKIVNIASSVFHVGVPNFSHYSASKGAVIALTRALARELGAHNINVNAIAPGLVSNEASRKVNSDEYLARSATTRAIPREMLEDDLVGTVLFLTSQDSDFITGQTFVVDGGQIMQ
jgi:NAD(P)-dependent dehydrogenase (short-subunit alcohol dehydrogenase family)